MEGLRYRSGTWICLVRDSVLCLLPPETAEERVQEIWSLLQAAPALDRVFSAVSGGFTGNLADMPSFGVLAVGERRHVLLRGPLELQQAGQSEPAASGEFVTTWSERVLSGPGRFTLRITAPAVAGTPGAGMLLPLESGIALVSTLEFGSPADTAAGAAAVTAAGAGADAAASAGAPAVPVAAERVEEPQAPVHVPAALAAAQVPERPAPAQPRHAAVAEPSDLPHGSAWDTAGSAETGSPEAGSPETGSGDTARDAGPAEAAGPATGSGDTARGTGPAEPAAEAENPDLGQTVRPPEEVPSETLYPEETLQPDQPDLPERPGQLEQSPAPRAGQLIDSVPWLRNNSAAAKPGAAPAPARAASAPRPAQASAPTQAAPPAPGRSASSASSAPSSPVSAPPVPAPPAAYAAPAPAAPAPTPAYAAPTPAYAAPTPAPAAVMDRDLPDGTDLDHDGDTIMSSELAKAAAPPVPESRPVTAPTVLARTCPAGHANPPTRSVCALCGQPLGEDPQPVARPALGNAVFSTGQVEPLDKNMVIGRQPSVARTPGSVMPRMVQVPSTGGDISRSHAEIRLEGWHVMLRDLNSTNGTVMVREGQLPHRLGQGEAVIVLDGDVAELGDGVWIRFEGLA